MRAGEHANLIGVFSWILAGIQVIFLIFSLYILIFGIAVIAAMLDPANKDNSGLVILGIVVAVIGLLAAFLAWRV